MSKWISVIFDAIIRVTFGPIKSFARTIKAVVKSIWHAIEGAARHGLQRVTQVLSGINNLGKAISSFVKSVANRFKDLYDRFVPQFVKNAVNAVRNFLLSTIARVANSLSAGIATLRRWAQGLINGAIALARSIQDWAAQQLAKLTNFVNTLIRALAHVLRGPRTLAEWLAAEMTAALWRYIRGNELRIGRWLRDRSVAFTVFAAGSIERLLSRLI